MPRSSTLPGGERALGRVAAAVADGERIAWGDVARRFGDSAAARTAQALRQIAARSERSDALTLGERRRYRFAERLVALGTRALTVLAAVQVLAGLAAWTWAAASPSWVPRLPIAMTALAFALAGAVLERAGRRDPRATDLAGFFLGVASAAAHPFLVAGGSLASVLRPFLPETFLPFFLWRFTRGFPRVVRLDRWAPVVDAALRVSAIAGAVLFLLNAWARSPLAPDAGLPPLARALLRGPASGYWLLVAGLCVPAPLVAWLRSRGAVAGERARVRRFLTGLAIGFVPLFAEVVVEVLWRDFRELMSQPQARRFGGLALYGLLLSVPLTTSFAVLGPSLVASPRDVLRSLRVALGHRAPVLATVVCLSLLATIVLRGSDQPLRVTLGHPAVAWLAAGGLLPLLVSRVVRRFGGRARRRADGFAAPGSLARELVDLAREIRGSRTRAELAGIVEQKASRQLGASTSRVFLRDVEGGSFVVADRAVRPLAVESALGRMLEASPEPVLLAADDPDGLLLLLPEEERLWVADAEADVAIPLPSSHGTCQGFLVFGPRPGEERYRFDEIEVLAAIAAAAALALERLPGAPATDAAGTVGDEPAGECRRCGAVSPRASGRCACGEAFAEAVIPFELAGKFRLQRVLGRGGMGVVYAAEDLALDRRVALKTLPHLDATALLRLRGEARSMARVVDPRLALIYGAETWRGVPILIVELLPGGTLAERLRRGPLAVAETLDLGIELAAGLAVMHAQGLLHRDVKPSNIAFTSEGGPKLLDFGLAELMDDALPRSAAPGDSPSPLPTSGAERARLTATDGVVGTPAYLSPEALAGAPPTPALDLWALHLCLWECLAGRLPAEPEAMGGPRGWLRRGPVPDVRTVRADCPAALAALIARGLEPEPRHRSASPVAVRDGLARLRGEPRT